MEDGVEETSKKLAELAPVVGAAQGDSIVDLIEGYEELAASLGADVESGAGCGGQGRVRGGPRRVHSRRRGQARADRARGQPVRATATPSRCPEYAPELLDLQQWGLDVIDPDEARPGVPVLADRSASRRPTRTSPTCSLFDDRNYPGNLETLEAQPIADSIKAFAAGAYTTWPAYWLHTYARLRRAAHGADRGDRARPTRRSATDRRRATGAPVGERPAPLARRAAPRRSGSSCCVGAAARRLLSSASRWARGRSRSATIWQAFTDFDPASASRDGHRARCACRGRCSASRSAPRSA